MFSCKFAAYFQNTFFLEHLWWKASVYCDKLALLSWEMGLRKGHLLLTLNKRHALPCFYWWFRVCFIPHKNKLLSRLLRIKYLSNSFYWFNISSKPCISIKHSHHTSFIGRSTWIFKSMPWRCIRGKFHICSVHGKSTNTVSLYPLNTFVTTLNIVRVSV